VSGVAGVGRGEGGGFQINLSLGVVEAMRVRFGIWEARRRICGGGRW